MFSYISGIGLLLCIAGLLCWSYYRQKPKQEHFLTSAMTGWALTGAALVCTLGTAFQPIKDSIRVNGYKQAISERYVGSFGKYLTVSSVTVHKHRNRTEFGDQTAEVSYSAVLNIHKKFDGCLSISSSSVCITSGTYPRGVRVDEGDVTLVQYSDGWEVR